MTSESSYFVWNIAPEVFSFSPLPRWYSLLFAIGIVGGYWIVRRFWAAANDENRSLAALDALLMYCVLGMAIGMRLGHVIFYDPIYFMQRPWEIPMIWLGGYASHGGFAGLAIALILFSRRYRGIRFLQLADHVSFASMFTAGLIRIGNFFNSEMVGHPATVSWAVVFQQIDNIPRHPAQIYEAVGYLLVCLNGYLLAKYTKITEQAGRLFGLTMILGFSWRFFCEFFKENQEAFENALPINMGQILSIPPVLIGIWLLVRKVKKEDSDQPAKSAGLGKKMEKKKSKKSGKRS